MLAVNQDSLRTVVERRTAYAKADDPVEFGRYLRRGIADGVPVDFICAGKLETPTGRIVVSDPFYVSADFTHPMVKTVPTGRLSVDLVVADFGPWGQRVAFAQLTIGSAPVVNWELALTAVSAPLNSLFGVDAGLACFADVEAAGVLGHTLGVYEAERHNYYNDVLAEEFEANGDNWCNHHPSAASTLNIIMFSSGMGDGVYSSYWGMAGDGAPQTLLIDFQVFDNEGPIVRV